MKRLLRVVMLLGAVAVLLGALSLTTREARATPASGKVSQSRFSPTSCGWSVVPSPNPSVTPSGLSAVAAVSANDVWAVGASGSQRSNGQTLIEHWDGASWQIVTSPNPGSIYNTLYGVTAISASDVWAVGYSVNTPGVTQTLIEHWDGTSWSVMKSPSSASMNNELFSVSAASARNVWAVGFITTLTSNQTPVDQTLIEHWNGTRWSVVKSPSPGSSSDHLSGVAVVSADDVWAVGNRNTFDQTLIEHWNGTRWSVVASPSPGSGDDLRGVTALSASNAWAVGYTSTSSSIQTLVEHWNGTRWQVVTTPPIVTNPTFSAVAATSADEVWAVGSSSNSTYLFLTLTERWSGSHGSIVPSPSPGSFATQLLGVAAVSAHDVWAVGYADNNTLTEHYQC